MEKWVSFVKFIHIHSYACTIYAYIRTHTHTHTGGVGAGRDPLSDGEFWGEGGDAHVLVGGGRGGGEGATRMANRTSHVSNMGSKPKAAKTPNIVAFGDVSASPLSVDRDRSRNTFVDKGVERELDRADRQKFSKVLSISSLGRK
jgi:hypothetical protein